METRKKEPRFVKSLPRIIWRWNNLVGDQYGDGVDRFGYSWYGLARNEEGKIIVHLKRRRTVISEHRRNTHFKYGRKSHFYNHRRRSHAF